MRGRQVHRRDDDHGAAPGLVHAFPLLDGDRPHRRVRHDELHLDDLRHLRRHVLLRGQLGCDLRLRGDLLLLALFVPLS